MVHEDGDIHVHVYDKLQCMLCTPKAGGGCSSAGELPMSTFLFTFGSFFSGQVQDLCEWSDQLSEVFIGQVKDHLDLVDPNLVITEVVELEKRRLSEMGCQWPSNEVSTVGMSLVNALTDTLWTIDGHHHVFASQGNQIGGPGLWNTIDLNSRSIGNVKQATCLLQCFSHCHRICSTAFRAATGTDLAG